MLEHTKRQVFDCKLLKHALCRYVCNRSLFDILLKLKWPKNKSVYELVGLLKHGISSKSDKPAMNSSPSLAKWSFKIDHSISNVNPKSAFKKSHQSIEFLTFFSKYFKQKLKEQLAIDPPRPLYILVVLPH